MTLPTKDRPQYVHGESVQEMYTYLDELRASGVTNMFGAGSWLQKEFGLTKEPAWEVLRFWMEDFGKVDKSVP